MRFRFRLDPLLEARRRREQAVQREVAALERQRMDLEDRLRRHQAQISRDKESLRRRLRGVMDMRTLRLGAGAALHAVRLARQTVLQLAGLNRRLEAARVRLLEATKRRRALELLRQRRHAQWKAALDKAETAALDDLAATAAARTSRPDPGLRP